MKSEKKFFPSRWMMLAALFTLHSSLYINNADAQLQKGKASFYSKRATGSRTANGERLHHDSLTCAHRTHPFGTILKVTHTGNGRSVLVRVNDRGPFVRGRVVDLSWGAANELGMTAEGIATVEVEPVAGDIVIPLRPTEAYKVKIPPLKIEPIELPDTLTPVWQEDLLIEHKKRQQTQKNGNAARKK